MRRMFSIFLLTILLGGVLPVQAKGPVRTLYLIRHGQYESDDPRDPDLGKALTPLGIAQARLVGARLRGMDVHFDRMVASTMTRARQTATVIHESFPELNAEPTRLLRECTPVTWREDIMAKTPAKEAEACGAQLEKAFQKYFRPSSDRNRNEILVCHGNVIRYFVTKALKVDTHAWLQMNIYNCSLTVIQIHEDGHMKLITFNDAAHIPAELRTSPGVHKPLVPLTE